MPKEKIPLKKDFLLQEILLKYPVLFTKGETVMQTMYVLCGIPASGKTTIGRKMAKQENAVLLSVEAIQREIYEKVPHKGNQNKKTYAMLWKRLKAAMEARQSIVIDGINGTAEQRIRYVHRARKRHYHAVCIYCQKHCGYAIGANRMREDGISKHPDSYIRHCFHSFIPPDRSEGWDEIHVMDGDRYSVEIEKQSYIRNLRTACNAPPFLSEF